MCSDAIHFINSLREQVQKGEMIAVRVTPTQACNAYTMVVTELFFSSLGGPLRN